MTGSYKHVHSTRPSSRQRDPSASALVTLRWSLVLLMPAQALWRLQTLETTGLGAISVAKAVALVAALSAIWYVCYHPRMALELWPFAVPAILYVSAMMAASGFRATTGESAAFVVTMPSQLLLGLTCAVWARSETRWEPLLYALASASFITGIALVLEAASLGAGSMIRPRGLGTDANSSNLPALLAMPLLAYALQQPGKLAGRAALAASYLFGWAGVVASASRSAAIAAIVGLILGIRGRRGLLVIALLGIAVWTAMYAGYKIPVLDADRLDRRAEWGARDVIWHETLDALVEHPFGFDDRLFSDIPHANLQFSTIRFGIPGAALYLAMSLPLVIGRRRASRRSHPEDKAIAWTAPWLTSLAGIVVWSEIGGVSVSTPWFWIPYGMSLGLAARRKASMRLPLPKRTSRVPPW